MSKIITFCPAAQPVLDEKIAFAVIVAQFQGKWVFRRQKKRTTWEIPGGHREFGESVTAAAKRELWEETGAKDFSIEHVCTYSVLRDGEESYGGLFYAQIKTLGGLPPEMEIGELCFEETLPNKLTYPEIQPTLYKYVVEWLKK